MCVENDHGFIIPTTRQVGQYPTRLKFRMKAHGCKIVCPQNEWFLERADSLTPPAQKKKHNYR